MKISLHNIKMTVIKTASKGVVNKHTIFSFSQTDNIVTAEYSGGRVRKGYLVGTISRNKLKFSYCQLHRDGKLDNGVSSCELSLNENGKIILTEHFEWKTRPGETGTNVFEQI